MFKVLTLVALLGLDAAGTGAIVIGLGALAGTKGIIMSEFSAFALVAGGILTLRLVFDLTSKFIDD